MDFQEAQAQWRNDAARLEEFGVYINGAKTYLPDGWNSNVNIAMDALPTLATVGSAGIPALLTTTIDPDVVNVAFTPNKAADIFGEVRKGDWLQETVIFPVVEHTGEVATYSDYSNNGATGVNTNWPQRQNYLFQTIKSYGEREMERAGLAKLGWVAEIDKAATLTMAKFLNTVYFFGVAGLQNYGLLNDPALLAAITPAPKANGGTKWIVNGIQNATANEVYADILALFAQMVLQTNGLVEATDKLTLALHPTQATALLATNSYNVNVSDLLKKNFPNLTIKTAVQYGAITSTNPQGIAAGNLAQLIADSVDGQKVGYCAFSEKLRTHPIIREMSAFKQKQTAGAWGTVVRIPYGIASLIGI